MLVSKVSNLITSAKAACNSRTWFTVYFILEGSEQKVESVILDDNGTSAGTSFLDQGTLILLSLAYIIGKRREVMTSQTKSVKQWDWLAHSERTR